MTPNEVAIRERFVSEVSQPFNVTAPAGSGKTYAIVRRVEKLIRAKAKKVALVTYTNKAAEEMKARLEALLKDYIYDSKSLFVGTIHSLCTELIKKYASAWGVVTPIDVVPTLDKLFEQYLLENPRVFSGLGSDVAERFEKHFELFDTKLLSEVEPEDVCADKFTLPPLLDLAPVMEMKMTKAASADMRLLRRWAQRFLQEGGWRGIVGTLERPTTVKAAKVYDEVFGAYEKWKSQQGYYYAQYLAYHFREYRQRQSKFSYDDLIDIVYAKLEAGEDYVVVLDEAQDTSNKQLAILERLAAKEEGKLNFTLVGDPQQSIYGSRASLSFYQQTIQRLCTQEGLEDITFQTTFRCDEAVVDWVNGLGDDLLDGRQDQASYVELSLRDEAKVGSVGRWVVDGEFSEIVNDRTNDRRHEFEAEFIAKKLLDVDLTSAHRIAILSPRKTQLSIVAQALKRHKIPHQIYSETADWGAPQRLLKSVATIMSRPYDAFEVIGFLREAFAIEDVAISKAYAQNKEAFNIAQDSELMMQGVLKEAVVLLEEAWKVASNSPIGLALRNFCQKIDLRNRVAALEGIVGENLLEEYDRVLAAMSVASDSVDSFDEFVDLTIQGSSDVKPGHVQLLSMHKSKGLEWDLVILPYMSAPISKKPPRYPCVEKSPAGDFLAFNKEQVDKVLEYRKARQENARLLYVAYTRARSHLILLDDRDLYAKSSDDSPVDLCGLDQEYKELFESLPSDVVLPRLESKIVETVCVEGDPWALDLPKPIEKITPSSQARENTDYEKRVQGGSMYGSDWHDAWAALKEQMPPEQIEEFLLAKAAGFDKAQRGLKEFKKLFSTELCQKMISLPFWTEVSLLAQLPSGVIEGRLDAVAKTPEGLWVVDWKTDHLQPQEIWETYKDQLNSYKLAMEQLEGKKVAASLYSTVHGVWIEDDGEGGCTLIT